MWGASGRQCVRELWQVTRPGLELGQVWALRVSFRPASFPIRFLALFATRLAVVYFSSSASSDRASVFGDPVISVIVGSDLTRLGISPNKGYYSVTVLAQSA